MIIGIGSDHGGYQLKEQIKKHYQNTSITIVDYGTKDTVSCDYPVYAKAVCEELLNGNIDYGILICTTGIGMSISSNRHKGIRAVLALNSDCAKFSRLHNNANVICLGSKYTDIDEAIEYITIFTTTEFEEDRHIRRIRLIEQEDEKLIVLNHPLIHHKLALIRDEKTTTKDFRQGVSEIASLMAYEVTRNIETKDIITRTPVGICKTRVLKQEVVIVPILRAGLGMVDGINALIPTAKVGHIGIYRDEKSLEPKEYYVKFPECIKDSLVIIVDPMLATGGSVVHAIDVVKKTGASDILYVGVVGSPEGVNFVKEKHPDVRVYLAALDDCLNDVGYIVPGLGDCGDRLFGTK